LVTDCCISLPCFLVCFLPQSLLVEDQQSEMYRDALFKEKRLREEADKKAREADATIRDKEQQYLIAGQQLKLAGEIARREAHAAHIARQSAMRHSNCLQLAYSARKEAEEKASMNEAKTKEIGARPGRS
ncbi:MAG: hypothetical protein ACKPKO_02595, partial [Candidatus Fonsibacter sp.]